MYEELEVTDRPIDTIKNINLTINKNLLLKALSHIQSIVEKRNIIPILSNVKLHTEDNYLHLTATDMDITVTEKIEATITNQGALTLPAHTLYDIVKKLPDDCSINFCVDEKIAGKLDIITSNCRFSLPFLPASEFPNMDQGIMAHEFIMHPEEFIYLIDKTKFAISVEETRYNLNGIYLHIHKNNDACYLRAAATDGHRLSKAEITAPENIGEMAGIIIPRKTVIEIRKLLEFAKDKVNISLSQNKINFNFNNINLTSKLVDASFPEYENLIPYNNNKKMEINSKIFSKAVDRVSTISSDKLRAVKLSLDNNKLTIMSHSDAQGSGTEEIEIEYDNENLAIGFNSKYLLDIMNVIQGEIAEFKFNDNYSPVLIIDKTDPGTTHVIMPMVV